LWFRTTPKRYLRQATTDLGFHGPWSEPTHSVTIP
jgi:hypothetical protein